MDYIKAGKITHYFDKIQVAVLQVTDEPISVGDKIRIGEFDVGVEQTVESMEADHEAVEVAKVGSEVGLKVVSLVNSGDVVYKVSE